MKLEALTTLLGWRNIFKNYKYARRQWKRSGTELSKMTFDVKCQLEMSIQFKSGYKRTLCLWAQWY